jgi:hypothetical protein
MFNNPIIEYASLSNSDDGLLLKFDCKDWIRALNCLAIHQLSGFAEFVKDGELLFKEVQISDSDVPSFIKNVESETGWHLLRFDFKENSTTRTIDFYTGEMYISFSTLTATEHFLNTYNENTTELFNELLLHMEHDVVRCESGFLVLPKGEGITLTTD